jgi:hypothetical protein
MCLRRVFFLMKWIQSALYPFTNRMPQTQLAPSAMVTFGVLFYAAISGGGFLFVVGQKPAALAMAVLPLLLVVTLAVMTGLGMMWEMMAELQDKDRYDGPSSEKLGQYLLEGAQAALFYGLILAFLVSSTLLLMPLGLLIPVALVFLYPVLLAPMIHSTHDRTFLGLLDGCLDVPKMLGNNYARLWAECTLYVLLTGGLMYPVLAGLLTGTVVGVFCLPGLLWMWASGLCRLVTSLHDKTLYFVREPRQIVLCAPVPEPVALPEPVSTRNVFHHQLNSINNSPFVGQETPWQ